ncbi:hypothetical protein HK096_000685, partial [Nowakowskiella sp. JEL0078]
MWVAKRCQPRQPQQLQILIALNSTNNVEELDTMEQLAAKLDLIVVIQTLVAQFPVRKQQLCPKLQQQLLRKTVAPHCTSNVEEMVIMVQHVVKKDHTARFQTR